MGQRRVLGCRVVWRRANRFGADITGPLNGASTVLSRFHGDLARA
jgi:hypothetical protein